MSDKPRLLWHSNSPSAGTGYGAQTALFTERLKDHYDLTISAFYGLEGNVSKWEGIPILPGIGNTYGNETIHEHAEAIWDGDLRGGLTVTLMDVWVLDPITWGALDLACWVPIDHEPAPPPVQAFFSNSGAVPIAMSKFGQEQLSEFEPLYCPHAVDTSVFKPYPKAQAREELGLDPDEFLVGMVAANKGNPSRKCFDEAFRAFKTFQARHPESRLYLHTEATGRFQGVNLPNLIADIGIPVEQTTFCSQYRVVHLPFKLDVMARLYSAMDVLLMPSAGEGFGIPAIEAQACGTPVIASDFSAQPELVGAGWLVSGAKTYTPIGSWQFRPDVEDIEDALEKAWRSSLSEVAAQQCSETAREFALGYDVEKVLGEFMLPALETARARLDDRKPTKLKVAA